MARRGRRTEAPDGEFDWRLLSSLLPFLWDFKWRAGLALLLLVSAKGATVAIPMVLKYIVDALDASKTAVIAAPIGLVIGYGALRASSSIFRELQTLVFARVRYGIMRTVSARLIKHLHALSLRYHLERKTGALTRDIDRGTNSIGTLLNYLLFNIVPTILEVVMVSTILLTTYSASFAGVIVATFTAYVIWTLVITQWRMKFRIESNKLDSKASSYAIDGLLNYETVKYFGNEEFETNRYQEALTNWQNSALRSQMSLNMLNGGQALIIAAGVTGVMILATQRVEAGDMSLGDLVAVNAYLLQLFMPLGFLGMVYTILKNSVTDMQRMFDILESEPEVQDKPNAAELVIDSPAIRFQNVHFGYDPERQILFDVDFEIPAGKRLAVVGPSGSGKSTLSRLLYRFYDVQKGAVLVDGNDIRDVTQDSLRSKIGIVPQDTVLFNDTLEYNFQYGRLDATKEELEKAAEMANLTEFIDSLPDGWQTVVGERGLKLSGGEKQRVAIARAILKNPPILIFDEATSSLDSESERSILEAMQDVSANRTTLTIAHRLSTITDSDEIIVLRHGKIVERGTHQELVAKGGEYATMWSLQQENSEDQ